MKEGFTSSRFSAFLLFFSLVLPSLSCAKEAPPAIKQVVDVRPALDELVRNHFEPLKGKRVGLICNQTSRTKNDEFSPNLFAAEKCFKLVALYTPEHGLFGQREAGVTSDTILRFREVPVYSLYGAARKPTKKMLKGVNTLVFDIQDIGVRPYTYLSTMILSMEAAAEAGIDFVVLDRPNPLSGERVEGNILDTTLISFVGQVPVPYLHGMTLGELARMAVEEKWFKKSAKLKLKVLPIAGWKRAMYWPQTGLAWTAPSPNIPSPLNAIGCAMLGATGELGFLSIGIGSDKPFLRLGSSLLSGQAMLRDAQRSLDKSIAYIQERYVATTSAGTKTFDGVRLELPDDWRTIGPMYHGQFLLLQELLKEPGIRETFDKIPASSLTMFEKVTGTKTLLPALKSNGDLSKMFADWKADAERFRVKRKKYLLYN